MTDTPTAPPRPSFGRYAATAGSATVLALAVGLGVVAARWSRLPATVATHWGTNGVDATQGRVTATVTTSAIVLGSGVLLAALALLVPAEARRILAAATGWSVGLVAVLAYGGLVDQAGLTDPASATIPAGVVVAAVVVAGVAAVGLWVLNPPPPGLRRTPGEPLPADAPVLDTAAGSSDDASSGASSSTSRGTTTDTLAWFGTASPSRGVSVLLLVVLLAVSVVAWLSSPWTALIPLAIGLALVVALHATVVVDERGVRVSTAGVDWISVPLDQIRSADHEHIDPLKQFGGYGMRMRKDRRGYVVHAGDALALRQADGIMTYVTTPHARDAAAVVNTLLTRL